MTLTSLIYNYYLLLNDESVNELLISMLSFEYNYIILVLASLIHQSIRVYFLYVPLHDNLGIKVLNL